VSVVLGIDPGLRGAVAMIEVIAGNVSSHWFTDDIASAAAEAARADLVVLEAQHASPRMGVTSAFALGLSYGFVLGLLATTAQRVAKVEPAVWRGAFGLTSKAGGIAMAREVIGEPTRALRHDEADAILLAWWGWRMVLSKAG
jgi:uncharacterized membrane protein